jgi:Trk K+ transport system NAD-binding subunit
LPPIERNRTVRGTRRDTRADWQEGRWRALRQDVAFHFERFLSRGPSSKVGFLWAAVVVVTLAGGFLAWLIPSGRFADLAEALWWAFLRLSDSGYLGEDEVTGLRIVSLVLTMLGLVLFVGVLVAILTESLTRHMERLALGLTPVRYTGHVAVLGWTSRTLELVAELLESSEDPPRVVVLVETITAQIEQDLRDRLPSRLRSRVVLRTGDPERMEDLLRVRGDRADAIVLPGVDRADRDGDAVDPRVLKVIASMDRLAGRAQRRPRVIAEIVDPQLVHVAHAAYEGPLQVIASDVLVGRSLALGVVAPGSSLALADLLDVHSGHTLRVERVPSLAGEAIAAASRRFPKAILLGALRHGPQGTQLNSAPDARIDDQDSLLFLSSVDGPLESFDPPPAEMEPETESGGQTHAPVSNRLLVLGWSGKVQALCRTLTGITDRELEIDIVSRLETARRESVIPHKLRDATVRHVLGDATSPELFDRLDPSGYDGVVVVGSDTAGDRLEADSRTIATVLLLLNSLRGATARPRMIAEVLDPANRAVLEERGVELVVTPELLARVLVGAVERPELAGIFEQLLLGRLGTFGVIHLDELLPLGDTSFGAIEWTLRRRGMVCVCLMRESRGNTPEFVRDKRVPFRLEPGDRALVVTPLKAAEGS